MLLAELRIAAPRWKIRSSHMEDEYLVFDYASSGEIRRLATTTGGKLRIVDDRSAYLPLESRLSPPDAILGRVKSLLQPK